MIAPPPKSLENGDEPRLGSYPTPLWKLSSSAGGEHDLWIKDDGRTGELYGGNKVRKLERLLRRARERRARRLLTVGAAGSHHVLATCVYGSRAGFATRAILTPQPRTAHAEATLRAGLHAGLTAVPARSYWDALRKLRREQHPDDYVIGPGGCGSEGTWAYRLAIDELRQQLDELRVERVDAIIVAAGSGSTASGLLAGILQTRIAKRIIAVQVAPNPALRALIVAQTMYALWRHDQSASLLDAMRLLRVDDSFLGAGYGHPSELGERASELARSFGLGLEPTYTAKAFAAAMSLAASTRGDNPRTKLRLHERRTYLYWHTLSAVPLTPLLVGAPDRLPAELADLLFEPSPNP
jgi:1-aminocyclopropane-1-carboxylate deaminase/D-cysteine desulfhydrase-like pyridoxal-dependent ACC family enzyme